MKANKTQIDELLSKAESPEGDAAFKDRIKALGITNLYEQLKKEKEGICTHFIAPLKKTTPEQLLAQVPQIDGLLLGMKKAVAHQLQVPQVEEKKPEAVFRPNLNGTVLQLQQDLNREFEERKGRSGDETVMAYGEVVAKKYHKQIEDQINGLWKQMDLQNVTTQSVANIEDIIMLHNTVKGREDLEHSEFQTAAIKRTLETSFKRHTNFPLNANQEQT